MYNIRYFLSPTILKQQKTSLTSLSKIKHGITETCHRTWHFTAFLRSAASPPASSSRIIIQVWLRMILFREGFQNTWELCGGLNDLSFFIPNIWEMIQFWLIFIQLGWNHQLDNFGEFYFDTNPPPPLTLQVFVEIDPFLFSSASDFEPTHRPRTTWGGNRVCVWILDASNHSFYKNVEYV